MQTSDFLEGMQKAIDAERIKKALQNGKETEAEILFRYSSLNLDEYHKLKNSCFDVNHHVEERVKQKEIEKIKRAVQDGQMEAAEYLFQYSDLSRNEFTEILEIYQRKDAIKQNPKRDGSKNGAVDVDNIWDSILQVMETAISKPSFDTWFSNTEGNIEGSTLIVSSRNEFQQDWLHQRYEKKSWKS